MFTLKKAKKKQAENSACFLTIQK